MQLILFPYRIEVVDNATTKTTFLANFCTLNQIIWIFSNLNSKMAKEFISIFPIGKGSMCVEHVDCIFQWT